MSIEMRIPRSVPSRVYCRSCFRFGLCQRNENTSCGVGVRLNQAMRVCAAAYADEREPPSSAARSSESFLNFAKLLRGYMRKEQL